MSMTRKIAIAALATSLLALSAPAAAAGVHWGAFLSLFGVQWG